MCFDFHTHTPRKNALVSAQSQPEGVSFWSLQVHPWELPETFAPLPGDFFDRLSAASALGEIGLDRLKGPALEIQKKYFSLLLSAAEKAGKPVVIHAVRCEAELDFFLERFSGKILIHGFCGGTKKLLHHLEKGRFVSFAPGAWRFHTALLRERGLERIGLETDAEEMYISEVYRMAEEETGISGWEERCGENFLDFIG